MSHKLTHETEHITIFLPRVPGNILKEARIEKAVNQEMHSIPDEDCFLISELYEIVFRRLLRINPRLRRPGPHTVPFITKPTSVTKKEAKRTLAAIHEIFDAHNLDPIFRKTYLLALSIEQFHRYLYLQASIELRTQQLVFH